MKRTEKYREMATNQADLVEPTWRHATPYNVNMGAYNITE